jgi:predicted ester cyclase
MPGTPTTRIGQLKLLDENHLVESDTVPEPVRGREPYRQFMVMYLRAFPDLHFTIDQMVASGDYVVTRYTATGTHRGELQSIPPTNRHAETHGCTVAEIRNGRTVRT